MSVELKVLGELHEGRGGWCLPSLTALMIDGFEHFRLFDIVKLRHTVRPIPSPYVGSSWWISQPNTLPCGEA